MVFPNIQTEFWQEDNGDNSSVLSLFAVKEWVENLPPSNHSEVVNRRRSEGGRPTGKVLVPLSKRQSLGPLQRPSVVTATDIYYQAMAKRRARAKLSVVSMIGFGESTINPPPWEANNNTVKPDRASMLRAAFSQRLDKSDGTGFSFDSYDRDGTVVDVFDEPGEFKDAEELLYELGFGGPNYGFERIPDRFLTPSMARGIDVTSFLHEHHRETTVIPPSRRTSGIFTTSQPSQNSSFEQLQQHQQPIIHHNEEEEEQQSTPVVMNHHLEEIAEINEPSPLPSEPQSTTSSRKSSLHRQDCFEDQRTFSDEEQSVQNDEVEEIVSVEPIKKDVEAVVSILQMAVEAYRVQVEAIDSCSDLNAIKDQLQQELSRTDQLLNALQDRVASSDPASLRTILDDMMVLLRHQQLLHRQVIQLRQSIPDSSCPSPEPSSQSSLYSGSSALIQVDSHWIQSFERRLTAQIRRTVRRELTRAFKRPLLVSKSKKRTN